MSVSLKYFFILTDADIIQPVARTRFHRICSGEQAMPGFAGKQVRCAEVMVEVQNRVPTRTVRDSYFMIIFDEFGSIDQANEENHARTVVEATADAVLERVGKSGNVLPAGSRFAQRRLEETHQWKPDHKLRMRILDKALARRG